MAQPQGSTNSPTQTRTSREHGAALFDLALGAAPDAGEPAVSDCGRRVGRYVLVRELGEGGFGLVWLAEQQEPFRREVAIKLIKPGMDSRQVIARFEAERQTLALMEHPNIAAVLDAGATPEGHPYFVMELVRGLPITTYCDQRLATLRQRLELFIQVCHGVQHAHQKAILHRDLKPSNILVEEVDGQPVPKIIDFGIAKALAVNARDQTDTGSFYTSPGAIIGTPQYMSPEQAGSALDVDACSDIYSLGTILYELLTGLPPIRAESFRQLPLDRVLQIIRDVEPLKPSQRVATALDEAAIRTAATERQTEPRKLAQELRGDLDWIVLKSLDKERRRRYESAAAFAADLQRHLQHEPVIARPPTRLYITRKFIRRNRVAVFGGTFISLALLGGAGAAFWGYVRQHEALKRSLIAETTARRETEKSQQVATFLGAIFEEISSRNSNTLTPDALRGLLDSAEERRQRQLQNNPETDRRVSLILAQAYRELDKLEVAEGLFRNAFRRYEQSGSGTSLEAADCLYWAVWCAQRMADESDFTGPMAEAESLLRRCLAIRTRLLSAGDPALLRTQALLAGVLRSEGKVEDAAAIVTSLTTGPASKNAMTLPAFGWVKREEALLSLQAHRYQQAEYALEYARKVLVSAAATLNQRRQVEADVARLERRLSLAKNDLDGAEIAASKELDLRHRWLGYEDPHVLVDIADIYLRTERPREAEAMLKRSAAISGQFGWLSAQTRALRELVKHGPDFYPSAPLEQVRGVTELARVLLLQADQATRDGQPSESWLSQARHLLETGPMPTEPYSPELADFFAIRGSLAARRADYATAIAELNRAASANPDDYRYAFQTAVFRVASHNLASFDLTREGLLRKLNLQTSAENILWISRAALLRPVASPESLKLIQDNLFRSSSQDDSLQNDWLPLLMGMAEYRGGNYRDATNWLDSAQRSEHPEIALQAQFMTAMNLHQLGDPAAQVALAEAVTGFDEQFARVEGTDLLPPLHDYLTVKILKEEAQMLLLPSSGR